MAPDAIELLLQLIAADGGDGILVPADPDRDALLQSLEACFAIDAHRALGAPGWHVYVTHTGRRIAERNG